MSNVIYLKDFEEQYSDKKVMAKLYTLYEKFDILRLLEEMTKFQQHRTRVGHLDRDMILKGIPLFTLIARKADTPDLKELARSYTKHLKAELATFYTNPRRKNA